jgi:phosphohistidine phosphatase
VAADLRVDPGHGVGEVKTLLLLRHAKSSWDDSTLEDHERPLNKRGRKDAPRMGTLVREHNLTPDLIITSDAVRARLTAEAVAEKAEYAGEIVTDPRLYLAAPDDIVSVLRTVPGTTAGKVMIVGHNPGLEELLARMTGEPEGMPTAALAQIELPIDRWLDLDESVRGTLVAHYRPKSVTDG